MWNNLEKVVGTIFVKRIAVGSKSERDAPCLRMDDGREFLISSLRDPTLEQRALLSLDGKRCEANGKFRGSGHFIAVFIVVLS